MTDIKINAAADKPLQVVVLVSGSGSNLQVLIDAMQLGELPINIVGVISNVKDALAVTRAQNANIATAVFSHIEEGVHAGKRMGIKTFERHATAQLAKWQPDLIVLAGFMRVLSADFINSIAAPMINLHPSLLPKYKGLDTHQRVLASDDTQHGCSVHVVTAELDAGQVLAQAILPIRKSDTPEQLQKRVQKLEHQILPWTILLIAKKVVDLSGTSEQEDLSSQNSFECLPNLPYRLWFDA